MDADALDVAEECGDTMSLDVARKVCQLLLWGFCESLCFLRSLGRAEAGTALLALGVTAFGNDVSNTELHELQPVVIVKFPAVSTTSESTLLSPVYMSER